MYNPGSKYKKELLQEIAAKSHSIAEMLRYLGLAQSGGNHRNLSKKIKYFDIDTKHFTGQQWNKGLTKETNESLENISRKLSRYSLEEIFNENASPSIKGKQLKSGLKKLGRAYECAKCENKGEWLGRPLTLHIDHKNGINNDNRPENLEYLCPNCHQQTPTWGNKNRSKKPAS